GALGAASGGVATMTVTADGKRGIAWSKDGTRVWDLVRGETLCWLHGANGAALSGALSPEGRWALAWFAAWQGSDRMALYDVRTAITVKVWAPDSKCRAPR